MELHRTYVFASPTRVFGLANFSMRQGSDCIRLRFLEMFKSDYYADVSLDQWLALTPPELVNAHLHADSQLMQALRKEKTPIV